jgi:hypothetical protein
MSVPTTTAETRLRDRSAAQLFALTSAVVYLGAGIIGFLVTGFDDFAGVTSEKVVILAVNPLHNIIHLTLGLGYLAGITSPGLARQINRAIGVGLLAAFVLGVAGGADLINITSVAEPDNWLHLVWGTTSLYFARAAAEQPFGRR